MADMLFFILKLTASVSFCFAIAYALTPATVSAARALGAIDVPDGVRKINRSSMPRLGGIGFFAAFIFGALLFLPFGDKAACAILIGGGIIVAFGVADDIRGLPPTIKLASQLFASAAVVLTVGSPESFSFFGVFSVPLTPAVGVIFSITRIAFTTNAVNFSDGLDGLASGLSAVATASLGIYALKHGDTDTALCAFIITASILGFLPHNKYRARVFMGDSGSQFLGISIAALALCASGGGFNLATSLFLAVPIFDTWFSIIRRILKGKSPFAADKGHLHHLLLSIGISHPTAVKLLVSLSAAIATVTLWFI